MCRNFCTPRPNFKKINFFVQGSRIFTTISSIAYINTRKSSEKSDYPEQKVDFLEEKMKISQQKYALIFNILVNSSLSSLLSNVPQKIIRK